MRVNNCNIRTLLLTLALFNSYTHSLFGNNETKQEPSFVCPPHKGIEPKWPRSRTYKTTPFKPGEVARYELKFSSLRVHVGYGFMRVNKPLKYKIAVGMTHKGELIQEKRWHRVYSVEAYTGDWYKAILQAHDKLKAFSRPWDGGISKFYISEDHDQPFKSRSLREKWLDFNHILCKAHTKEELRSKNKHKEGEYDLVPGSADALGAVYKLRTIDYKIGKKVAFDVYTSEENWPLEALPLAIETIETKAGSFETVKLSLKTNVGEDLEQKGKLFVWIGTKHKSRPLVKVEGTAKFGDFFMELDQFKPGS